MDLSNSTRCARLGSPVSAAFFVVFSIFSAACSQVTPLPAPSREPAPVPSPGAPVAPSKSDEMPGAGPLDLSTRTLPAEVERERLEKDVAMISRLRSMLPPASTSVSEFVRQLGGRKARDESDLGFGLRGQSFAMEGGYASCEVDLAAHDDLMVGLKVTCTARTNDAQEVALATIKEALGPEFREQQTPVYFMASADYSRGADSAAARAELDKALGPLAPSDENTLTPELRDAYRLLMSPVEQLTVGYHCGIAGTTPPGAAAEATLQTAKRVDLLRNVLRGPNPGGRMYAFRALTRLKALAPDDVAVLKALSSTKTLVETCHGCIFSHETTAYVLEDKYF